MVELIIGRAGVGKTFRCLQRAREILEREPLKTPIIFLLPAYQTYRAELELAALTGGAVNTRMQSFNRFARQILDEVGGALSPRISEIGRRLLLRKILLRRDKAADLKFFVRAAKQHGFAEILSDELKELRTYNLDGDKLDAAADSVDDDELRDKLRDLKILAEDFRDALTDKLTDDGNLLEHAAELLAQSPTVASAEIFVDGFIFFDPQQRNFLRQLFTHARNVHITLPMDTNLNSRENLSEVGIFNRASQTFHTLKNLAADVGVEVSITRLESPRRFLSTPLKILDRRLFDYAPKKFDGSATGLTVVEAVNRRAEVEATAREILRLVKSGWRLRDIGILVRDETYFKLVKPLFEVHAIPFFVDIKRAAAHHPAAELLRAALEVVLRGWRREAMFRCLRTGFFDAAQDELDLLENYVVEFGVKGAAWLRTWDWRRVRSLDMPNRLPDAAELELLERVNEIRRRVVKPLEHLAERVKSAAGDVVALTTALFNLLEELNVHARLEDWSRTEELRGNLALSREHLKIWDDVVTLFEQVVDSLGDDTITARDFDAIICEGLDALEMSLIPPGLDEVTVAQFEQNSLQNSRAIFVLGFDDKNFPRSVVEKPLLNDADRLRLQQAGVEISLGGREQLLAEKFLIYRGLTEAREFLWLSYPTADAAGDKISASPLLSKIRAIFDVPTVRVELDVLQSLGSEIFAAGERTLSQSTAERLYAPSRRMRASVTKFESFNECPFKFFAEHGLKLAERAEYKVQSPDIGNILHAVMRRFGLDLKRENRPWSSVSAVELNGRVDKILDELTPRVHNKILLSTKTLEHRRERIKLVAVESLSRLIKLDAVSQFHPKIFETPFDELNGTRKVGDVTIDLSGRIDRIDLSGDGKYFLIIDYKTGKATLTLQKIYGGLSLQLAVYLGAAKNLSAVGSREAGAMLYCLLRLSRGSGRNDDEANSKGVDDLKMPGLLRVDDEIKNAVDSTGNFVAMKDKNLLSRDDLQTVINYAEKILQTTAERILSGDIEVKPAKFGKDDDACEYCPFTALCDFDRAVNDISAPIKDDDVLAAMRAAINDA